MEGLELIAFNIIANCGYARSEYIECIKKAKKGEFYLIEKLFDSGDDAFLKGHEEHNKLLTLEAEGKKNDLTLLLIHAEDQLMSAEGFRIIAREMVDLYKKIYEVE